jgi:hypothetical protein
MVIKLSIEVDTLQIYEGLCEPKNIQHLREAEKYKHF